jgi:hypothetical protein
VIRSLTSLVLALLLIGATLSACSTTSPRTADGRSAPTGTLATLATLGQVPRTTGYTALAPEVNNEGVREATALIVERGVTRLVDEQAAP